MAAQTLGFALLKPYGVYPWQTYMPSDMVHGPCQECPELLLLPLLQVGGDFMVLIQLSPNPYINMLGHTVLGLCKVIQSQPSIHCREAVFHVVFHPVTQLTLELCWVLNIVILV